MRTLFRLMIGYFDRAASPPERRARINNTLLFPVPTDVDSLRFPVPTEIDSPDYQFEFFDFDDLSFALSVPYAVEDALSSFLSEVFPQLRHGGYWTASSDGGEDSRHGSEELIRSGSSNEELSAGDGSDSGGFHHQIDTAENATTESQTHEPSVDSQTRDMVDCIPEEVLVELCCRLPKKYQLRCKIVSKNWQNKWQNLIAQAASLPISRVLDSGFIEWSFDGSGDSLFKFYRFNHKGQLLHLDSLKTPHPSQFGSHNGFLFYFDEFPFEDPKKGFHLYNPVTRQCTTLPDLPIADNVCPSISGKGVAPHHIPNHYKFFVVFSTDSEFKVAYFDSETREWELKTPVPGYHNPHSFGAATLYCRGSFYWYCMGVPSWLMVYCTMTENFRKISLPEVVRRNLIEGVVYESEGNIHFCCFMWSLGLYIWVLEENPAGSTWRNIYCVATDSILVQAELDPDIGITRVCAHNEHLQILLVDTKESGLLSYNLS